MDRNKEKACLCALNRTFGFEPKIGLALLSHLGSAEEVFGLSGKDMDLLLGPHSRYKGHLSWNNVEKEHEELVRISGRGIRFTGWTEEGYPELLKDCPDAPIGLYVHRTQNYGASAEPYRWSAHATFLLTAGNGAPGSYRAWGHVLKSLQS